MKIATRSSLLIVLGLAVASHSSSIRGKVTTQAGRPLANAVVTVVGKGLSATSATDGAYSINTSALAVSPRSAGGTRTFSVRDGVLEIVVDRAEPVRVETFDSKGVRRTLQAMGGGIGGISRWNLGASASGSKVLLVNAKVGSSHATFRYIQFGNDGYLSSFDPATGSAGFLARSMAVTDSLSISANGYSTKSIPLRSLDTLVNVSLDTVLTGGYPLKNTPVPSAGCGKPTTITTSTSYRTITSSGDKRQYMITMPPNYDVNKPYRYIYASHGLGGEGSDITREKYYNIQNIAEAASSTIFVSASGLGGAWGLKDVPLFDDILALVEQNACVDKSRVFVLGFSFGGMYSYSLSMTRQKVIRAGIGMAPANFNISIPTKSHAPIAWMQSTGMSDRTCPWVSNESQKTGAKFIAIEHGTDNGCTIPNPIPTWKSGAMLCNEFANCKPGYPTRVCTFDGGHGLPGGFSGAATWMWEFISRF